MSSLSTGAKTGVIRTGVTRRNNPEVKRPESPSRGRLPLAVEERTKATDSDFFRRSGETSSSRNPSRSRSGSPKGNVESEGSYAPAGRSRSRSPSSADYHTAERPRTQSPGTPEYHTAQRPRSPSPARPAVPVVSERSRVAHREVPTQEIKNEPTPTLRRGRERIVNRQNAEAPIKVPSREPSLTRRVPSREPSLTRRESPHRESSLTRRVPSREPSPTRREPSLTRRESPSVRSSSPSLTRREPPARVPSPVRRTSPVETIVNSSVQSRIGRMLPRPDSPSRRPDSPSRRAETLRSPTLRARPTENYHALRSPLVKKITINQDLAAISNLTRKR